MWARSRLSSCREGKIAADNKVPVRFSASRKTNRLSDFGDAMSFKVSFRDSPVAWDWQLPSGRIDDLQSV